jgi:predicted murein hydrolase (TIGR00659 family)
VTSGTSLWVYLASTPLLWLALTLTAYALAYRLFLASGMRPIVNPVVIAAGAIIVLLLATDTSYDAYFDGAQFVHFLLGPAIVALAVPLFDQARRIRRVLLPMAVALVAGSITAITSTVAVAWALGASRETLLSLAPKSVTTPIAMGISERIGGLPSLTAAFVLITGITGAIVATPFLNALGFRDWRARGFAVGIAAHGLGMARAFQVNELAGIFAAIAMALNGLVTAILVPLLVPLLF